MACGALASLSRMRRGPCGPEFLTGGRVSQPWSRRRSSSLRHSWSFNLPFARVQSNRSEEHTSELQSRLHLVCRLLLEKKNKHRRLHSSLRPSAIGVSRDPSCQDVGREQERQGALAISESACSGVTPQSCQHLHV